MESSKRLFAAIIAAGIMGTGSLAFAQPGPGGPGSCDGPMGMRGTMGGGMKGANFDRFDPSARADQRLTRLHADLKVTAEQEPLWQAFAEKAKAEAGKGLQAMRDNAQDLSLSAPERMTRMAEVMKQRVAAMESVNDSFRRLYDALTPDQKRVADIHAARMGRMGGHRGPMGQRGGMPPVPPAPPTKG
jgi:hypothetical protein